ncbi:aldo/keto reductase [Clostridium sp. Marseille-P2415]|uniref:aldo/keto reductase n=1 Tax=Clostridium sp. Marseille-P2415 TaxID=1805471 RepID=UPI0009886952|nr:aldo/keto reductase [Clostridium sp. Marseille-P2415]
MEKMVTLPDGTEVPAIGQGTWFLGERTGNRESEEETLRAGIDAGMTLLDTAEMYGNGKAEELIGQAIKGYDRSSLFLVSKVYPYNAGRKNIFKSCMESMGRLNTGYLDLYLLHWRGGIPLKETVECMEQLKKEGKIRSWGVSNFDTDDMEELWSVPGGKNCAVNQVLYHVASRGIEYDLLPWMREHGVPVMAYCPLAQAGDLKRGLYESPVLSRIAEAHQCSISQVLLAFVIRGGDVIAIPRTGKKEHALDNAKAWEVELTEEEMAEIDRAFPAPARKVYLDIV